MNESAQPGSARRGHASRIAWAGIPADPDGAARARAELTTWLQRHFTLGGERLSDVVLAVYEALANAVEAATANDATMDVHAAYDAEHRTLIVTVVDRGEWRASGRPPAAGLHRGRGIPLMRALADHVGIGTTDRATAVELTWEDIAAAAGRGA